MIHDTFFEYTPGAVAAAMADLSRMHRSRQHSNGKPGSQISRGLWLSLADRVADLSAFMKHGPRIRRKKQDEDPDDEAHEPNPDNEDIEMQASDAESQAHLFVCVTVKGQRENTRMVPLGMAIQDDRTLFRVLRTEYRRVAGFWRRLLGLKRILCIRFVQVSNRESTASASPDSCIVSDDPSSSILRIQTLPTGPSNIGMPSAAKRLLGSRKVGMVL